MSVLTVSCSLAFSYEVIQSETGAEISTYLPWDSETEYSVILRSHRKHTQRFNFQLAVSHYCEIYHSCLYPWILSPAPSQQTTEKRGHKEPIRWTRIKQNCYLKRIYCILSKHNCYFSKVHPSRFHPLISGGIQVNNWGV